MASHLQLQVALTSLRNEGRHCALYQGMSPKSYQRISHFFVSFSTALSALLGAKRNASPQSWKFWWSAPVLGCSLTANARDARGPDISLGSRHKCFLRRRRRFDSYNLPYSFSPELGRHPSRASVTHRTYHRTPDRGVRALLSFRTGPLCAAPLRARVKGAV